MCLEYVAEQSGVVESFWSFTIETLSLSIPFLWVGTSREPLVYLNRAHLNLGDLLVGVLHTYAQRLWLLFGVFVHL